MDYLHTVTIILLYLCGLQAADVAPDQPKLRCAIPKLEENVRYRLSNEGDRLHYHCRRGYLTLGDVFAECKQGQWSSHPPICIARGCKPVYYLDHGRVMLGYGGAMIKFTCDEGYHMEGDKVMVCDGRKWNTTIPKCRDWSHDDRREEIAFSHNRQKTKSHADWLLEADYSCIKRKSSIRPPKINHTIANTQWAIIEGKPRLFTAYRCHWGYTSESKARYMYCQNGKWIGALPKCKATATHIRHMVPRDQPDPGKARTHTDWLQMADYTCIGSTKQPKQILPNPVDGGKFSLRHDVIDGEPRLYAELVCDRGYSRYHGNKYVYCMDKSWYGPKTMCVMNDKDGSTSCAVANGGCDHNCEMDSEGISCSCKEGYILGADGRKCVDVDECKDKKSICEHVCQNTAGSYRCHCYVGYLLAEDNHTCKPDPDYKGHELIPPMALFSH